VEEIFENLAVGRQRSAIRQGKAAQLCANMMTVAEVYAKLG
jgi:hypothetical protein